MAASVLGPLILAQARRLGRTGGGGDVHMLLKLIRRNIAPRHPSGFRLRPRPLRKTERLLGDDVIESRREMEGGEQQQQLIRSASEEVSRQFKTLVDAGDVDALKQLQHLILGRLQDSNAVLSHFNEYSERCYSEVSADFSRNTRLLKSMKTDLDHIFLKLRNMKAKLLAIYPDAFPDASTAMEMDRRPDLERPIHPT